jgi:hypothetical protein
MDAALTEHPKDFAAYGGLFVGEQREQGGLDGAGLSICAGTACVAREAVEGGLRFRIAQKVPLRRPCAATGADPNSKELERSMEALCQGTALPCVSAVSAVSVSADLV